MEKQGQERFEKYHFLLLRAFFEENLDISDPDILSRLAREAGADLKVFTADLRSGKGLQRVIAEHRLAVEQYAIHAVPTVIIGGQEKVVGAVPRQAYQEALEKTLARRG